MTTTLTTLAATIACFIAARAAVAQVLRRFPRLAAGLLPEPASSNLVAALVAVTGGLVAMQFSDARTAATRLEALIAPSHAETSPGNAVSRLDAYARRLDRAAPPPMTPMPKRDAAEGLPDVQTMIERLAARLQADGSDAEGWRTLGWSYAATGNYAAAVPAYRRALELNPADVELAAAAGEAMTKDAGDKVEPPALALFEQVLSTAPDHPRARFYRGLSRHQAGDHKAAVDEWRALLRAHPEDATWAEDVRTHLASAEAKAGSLQPPSPPAAEASGSAPERK